MSALVVYGGYIDTSKLVPRPSKRGRWDLGPSPLAASTEQQLTLDTWQYTRQPIGYRLMFGWNLLRNYELWE